MKKFAIVLVFILGFLVVFAVSGVVTFMVTLDKNDAAEDPTEAVYAGGAVLPESENLENDTAVTRVTPSLKVEDAIIVHGLYGENKTAKSESYEMPEVTAGDYEDEAVEDAVVEEAAVKTETKVEAKAETKKETKTETKAETKKETKSEQKVEAKAEEPKQEEVKKEEVKAETPKAEEPKVEAPKVEEPKVEEPKAEEPKAETPKVEEKPQLNPNVQTSDNGL